MLVLFALLLIPIATSSLRGLTHILTCEQPSTTPFSIVGPGKDDDDPPTLISSKDIKRGDAENDEGAQVETKDKTVCEGLSLDMAAEFSQERSEHVAMLLTIENRTSDLWRGTVSLLLEDTRIPVNIGEIAAGESESEQVDLSLDSGTQRELTGSLLIGP